MYKVITNQDNDIYVTPENEMLSFDAVTNKELENAVSDLESVIDTKYDKTSAEQEHYALSEKIDAEESRAVAKETDLLSAIQNVETAVSQTLDSAKDYTDTKLANLVNSAPETLDTLGELATALQENENVVDVLNSSISNKANRSELDTTNTNVTKLSERVTALETDDGVTTIDIISTSTGDPIDNVIGFTSRFTKCTKYDGSLRDTLIELFGDSYKPRLCKIERVYMGNDITSGIISRYGNTCYIEPIRGTYMYEISLTNTTTCWLYHNDVMTFSTQFKLYEVYD